MKRARSLAICSLIALTSTISIAAPDLICSEITSPTTFGFVDGKMAYSFGTTLCNIGDAPIPWIDNTNEHPLVSQTLYKLSNGQLTQIGIGFVRHGFSALSSDACSLGCTPAGFSALGAGCSTSNSSVTNGLQILMGPRSEIDPFTGFFPFPFTAMGLSGDAIYKRLQVNLADISDPAALYFVETQVITSAETSSAERSNNASYRQVVFSPGAANASLVGPTYTQQPAIFAWRDHGNGIGIPDPTVLIVEATIPGDGIIHIGSKATDLGTGNFRYDYAVHNQNAQNALGSLMVPGAGVYDSITNATFNDVDYHDDLDGLIDGTDHLRYASTINTYWIKNNTPNSALRNIIRWGTTYSYSFEAPNEPRTFQTVLFRYATTPLVAQAIVPTLGDVCHANFTGSGFLSFHDVSGFLGAFSAQAPGADFNPDGVFDFFDVAAFLVAYAAGCP